MKITKLNKTRKDLASRFKGVGAEIGVERGVFSRTICKMGKIKKFYAIDCWETFGNYRDHVPQKRLDSFYETTKKRLAPYNATLIKKFSLDAAGDFMDESLDFVYIDANHSYEEVLKDLEAWSKKVKKGGIVAGHDYVDQKKESSHYSVVQAVNDFVKKHNISELTVYAKDSSPSWKFVKK